jgi:transposase
MAIIGIDVSKQKLDCAWLKEVEPVKVKSRVLENSPRGFETLIDWAVSHSGEHIQAIHFVMEATGIYHEAVAQRLYEAGAKVSVINPAHLKNYTKSQGRRSKTDKKDSIVLARYGASHSLRLWEPEPEAVRTLKALLARYDAVKSDIQRELNRLEKATITQASEQVIHSIKTVLEQLEHEKQRLEKVIDQHIDDHPDLKRDRKLLDSIPGVGPVIARQMLAVIRSRRFESAGQCAAFLGLVPIYEESGSSVRGRSKLSKVGNASVRAKLYLAAVVATRYNPDIKRQYERLCKNGKCKMSAIGAAMRKLVHICFGVLKHQVPYQAQTA